MENVIFSLQEFKPFSRINKMRPVLIVEDNPVFCTILKGILTARIPSIVVEEASNGEEALIQFRKINPSLIFMDIRLPDGSGLEITRTIKKIDPEIEIIILTSHDMPEYREVAFFNGASHFVIKGNLKIDDVISLVTSALKSKDKKYRNEYPFN